MLASKCLPGHVQQLFGVVNPRHCCDWSTYLCLIVEAKINRGCSRNTCIDKFPALQCVWKHIANSTVQPKYPELE